MNRIKSKADYSDYLASLPSQNTVRKISQPVKITQLLGSSGWLASGRKNSAISLPERITPYLKKKTSSRKKNETNVRMKLPRNERNVRRNLKFTETSISATKTKGCTKTGMNYENDCRKKENLRLSTRTSFLLPPNTIKELHIKNRFQRDGSNVSQFRVLTMNPENINHRISETSESCSPPVENANARANFIVPVKENETSVIRSVSSPMFRVNEPSGINILRSSYSNLADTDDSTVKRRERKIPESLNSNEISNVCIYGSQNNDCDSTIDASRLSSASDTDVRIDVDPYSVDNVDRNDIRCTIRRSPTTCIPRDAGKETNLIKVVERESSSETTNIYREDSHPSLRTVKMIRDSCFDLQRSANEDERVTLRKTEFTDLVSKLKRLVCRLEEDVSVLKLTITTVTELLSATSVTNEEIKGDNDIEIARQTSEIPEELNDNVRVMNNMDVAVIDTERDNTLKETPVMLDANRSNFLETNEKGNPEMRLSDRMYIASESNERNEEIPNSPIVERCRESKSGTRRRSVRLMAKVLNNSNAANDSFVNLENELDIVNRRSNTPVTPLTNRTPAKNKYRDKRIEGRPMKEYMALKSRISCLLTPNVKRLDPSESKNNVHLETDDVKSSVSNKVLAELYNLYEDSL